MCHFNSPGSIQSCSRSGALNLSYTLPFLFYQVLIFTRIKWSIRGWSVLPKDTPSLQCPKIEREETWYFSENPAPSGIRNRTAGSDIGKAPRSNHCAMSLSRYQKKYSNHTLVAMWVSAWAKWIIYNCEYLQNSWPMAKNIRNKFSNSIFCRNHKLSIHVRQIIEEKTCSIYILLPFFFNL